MDLALIFLIAAALSGGILGAIIRAWSIHSLLYSLQDRLLVVEGVTQREVKIRAGQERWKRPAKDEELARELMKNAAPAVAYQGPWWTNPALKRGGVPSGTVQ